MPEHPAEIANLEQTGKNWGDLAAIEQAGQALGNILPQRQSKLTLRYLHYMADEQPSGTGGHLLAAISKASGRSLAAIEQMATLDSGAVLVSHSFSSKQRHWKGKQNGRAMLNYLRYALADQQAEPLRNTTYKTQNADLFLGQQAAEASVRLLQAKTWGEAGNGRWEK